MDSITERERKVRALHSKYSECSLEQMFVSEKLNVIEELKDSLAYILQRFKKLTLISHSYLKHSTKLTDTLWAYSRKLCGVTELVHIGEGLSQIVQLQRLLNQFILSVTARNNDFMESIKIVKKKMKESKEIRGILDKSFEEYSTNSQDQKENRKWELAIEGLLNRTSKIMETHNREFKENICDQFEEFSTNFISGSSRCDTMQDTYFNQAIKDINGRKEIKRKIKNQRSMSTVNDERSLRETSPAALNKVTKVNSLSEESSSSSSALSENDDSNEEMGVQTAGRSSRKERKDNQSTTVEKKRRRQKNKELTTSGDNNHPALQPCESINDNQKIDEAQSQTIESENLHCAQNGGANGENGKVQVEESHSKEEEEHMELLMRHIAQKERKYIRKKRKKQSLQLDPRIVLNPNWRPNNNNRTQRSQTQSVLTAFQSSPELLTPQSTRNAGNNGIEVQCINEAGAHKDESDREYKHDEFHDSDSDGRNEHPGVSFVKYNIPKDKGRAFQSSSHRNLQTCKSDDRLLTKISRDDEKSLRTSSDSKLKSKKGKRHLFSHTTSNYRLHLDGISFDRKLKDKEGGRKEKKDKDFLSTLGASMNSSKTKIMKLKSHREPLTPSSMGFVNSLDRQIEQVLRELESTDQITFIYNFNPQNNSLPQVRSGTIEKLVERLTLETLPQDITFRNTLLITYSSFVTAEKLMDLLFDRFDEAVRLSAPRTLLRVVSLLKTWIEFHPYDFYDPKLRRKLVLYNDSTIHREIPEGAKLIQNALETFVDSPSSISLTNLVPPSNFDLNLLKPDVISFEVLPTIEVARQLTLLESENCCAVKLSECLKKKWSSKDKSLAPNILHLIDNFNRTSKWVITEVLKRMRLEERVKIMRKFIALAKELRNMNNFNGVMELIGGLNSCPVRRLKASWKEIPEDEIQIVDELDNEMKYDSNYKRYRSACREAVPPIIPYLGIYLTDLTFIEDGNPNYCDNNHINISKFEKIANVIMEIKSQQNRYPFTPIPEIQNYLKEFQPFTEEEAYSMSTRLEPRDTGEALEKLLIEEERLKKLVESYEIRIHDLEYSEKNHITTIAYLNTLLREQRKLISDTDTQTKHFSIATAPIGV